MFLPKSIRSMVGGRFSVAEGIGMSGASVYYLDDLVLKIENADRESENNLTMLRWLRGKVPVPDVLAEETVDGARYLLMSRLPGKMACDGAYLAQPEKVVKLLAEGLQMLWSVDPEGCPCDQTLSRKLENARYQVENGLVDMDNVDPETFGEDGFASPAALLRWLEEHRPAEEPVLSHGDYCLPNVFFGDGQVSGFLDLGRSGIADRWLDIAICWRSLRDNFNGAHGHTDPDFDPDSLFRELGIQPDWEKIRYYLLVDELF